MKKAISALISIIVLLFSVNVQGSEIVDSTTYYNKNNVAISKNNLDKLTAIFPISQIDKMDEKTINEYLNGKIVSSEIKYYKTIYYSNGKSTETEITKEEYDNVPSIKVCTDKTRGSDAGYFETSYKSFGANLVELSTKHSLIIMLTWKIMPATRSYDVIAFRTKHMSYSNVDGCQTYFSNGDYTDINYDTNSAGYKGLSNGAGISMNLKDGTNITQLMLALWADLQISEYNYDYARVFTTYQHAQSSLTRAQSKSYTLQVGGLGNVVYYNDMNIWNKYDDMTGIELIIPTT